MALAHAADPCATAGGRRTLGTFEDGTALDITDNWLKLHQPHRALEQRWKGSTVFELRLGSSGPGKIMSLKSYPAHSQKRAGTGRKARGRRYS